MTQTVSAGTAACHPSTGARLVADVGGTNARFAWQAGPGLPLEAVKQMYPLYDFDPVIKASDIEELKRTQDFLLQNGMLKKSIEIEKLIAPLK